MALSFARTTGVAPVISGGRKYITGTLTLDASYTNGTGWTLDPVALLGFYRNVDSMVVLTHNADSYSFKFTPGDVGTLPVLKAFVPAFITGATAAGGTTGTFMTDSTGAETTGRLQSAATAATVKGIRSVEAATNEAFLGSKTIQVTFSGW